MFEPDGRWLDALVWSIQLSRIPWSSNVIGKKGEMGTTLSQEECGHVLPQINDLEKGGV